MALVIDNLILLYIQLKQYKLKISFTFIEKYLGPFLAFMRKTIISNSPATGSWVIIIFYLPRVLIRYSLINDIKLNLY